MRCDDACDDACDVGGVGIHGPNRPHGTQPPFALIHSEVVGEPVLVVLDPAALDAARTAHPGSVVYGSDEVEKLHRLLPEAPEGEPPQDSGAGPTLASLAAQALPGGEGDPGRRARAGRLLRAVHAAKKALGGVVVWASAPKGGGGANPLSGTRDRQGVGAGVGGVPSGGYDRFGHPARSANIGRAAAEVGK